MKEGRSNGNAVRWLGAALLLVAACKATTAESARASAAPNPPAQDSTISSPVSPAADSAASDSALASPSTPSSPVAAPEILQVRTFWSNMYLIRSDKLIMVDAGSPHDWKALNKALAKHHLKLNDISMLILSHGHGDHAALSKAIRDGSHCKIVVGRGDLPMVRNGHNDKLKSNNMTAVLMKPIIDFKYPTFEPDIVVDSVLDLHPYGLAGRVIAVPGHTPGSLAVVLDDKRALVGDMMLGGIFGGLFFAGKPGEHYFHADKEADHKRISELLALGVKSFYLGHGGPVERDAVIKAFAIKTQ